VPGAESAVASKMMTKIEIDRSMKRKPFLI